MLTVMSWNMAGRVDAWEHAPFLVKQHAVSLALLQEAKNPADRQPAGWSVNPPASSEPKDQRWRIAVPAKRLDANGEVKDVEGRWFASAAVATGSIEFTARVPKPLHEAPDQTFAASHPGQFAVSATTTAEGKRLTVISLYGVWDRMLDSGAMFSEATTHRAISDLTVLFQERGADLILIGGDLNIYSYSDSTPAGRRWMTVLDRLAAYGLEVCGPFRAEGEPRLEGCPCPDRECRHVNTYRYRSKETSKPHQLDFFLATPALRELLRACWADPDPNWPAYSDHRPIFANSEL